MKDNIITLKPKVSNIDENGIIESKNNTEGATMPKETYGKSEIDLKFNKISSDIQHGFDKLDSKFEQVDLKFEKLEQKIDFSIQQTLSETKNMLLEQQVKEKNERENERKTTNRWLISIAISLVGLIISIIVNFFLSK